MTLGIGEQDRERRIREAFRAAGVEVHSVTSKEYPGESIFVVEVYADIEKAAEVANALDRDLVEGFVTVRLAKRPLLKRDATAVKSIQDLRVTDLLMLLTSRSRTSEAQPSLRYMEDAPQRLKIATSARHNLIFGRRGVGKTALMLEAKETVLRQGQATVWVNVHSLGAVDGGRAFLSVARTVCELPEMHFRERSTKPHSVEVARETRALIDGVLATGRSGPRETAPVVAAVQRVLLHFTGEIAGAVYLFLDDFHYLRPKHVPLFLDLVHACTRDTRTWIKAAAVRHQTRWFVASPPTGLQSGQDATIIDLDITLENPRRAREFLTSVLREYFEEAGMRGHGAVLSNEALDRLVLASGGVPRDFLTLCASSVEVARARPKARVAGVQDVNNAAGRAAAAKLEELERDAAASLGGAEAVLGALQIVREFLLREAEFNYLRIDFQGKERHPREYALIQSLMDLRLLHLLSGGVSARHEAGRRSEAYLLDLSQYSGQRLKWNLTVLDFVKDHLVVKRTRSSAPTRHGNTPKQLVDILRSGPEFDLSRLRGHSAAMRQLAG